MGILRGEKKNTQKKTSITSDQLKIEIQTITPIIISTPVTHIAKVAGPHNPAIENTSQIAVIYSTGIIKQFIILWDFFLDK